MMCAKKNSPLKQADVVKSPAKQVRKQFEKTLKPPMVEASVAKPKDDAKKSFDKTISKFNAEAQAKQGKNNVKVASTPTKKVNKPSTIVGEANITKSRDSSQDKAKSNTKPSIESISQSNKSFDKLNISTNSSDYRNEKPVDKTKNQSDFSKDVCNKVLKSDKADIKIIKDTQAKKTVMKVNANIKNVKKSDKKIVDIVKKKNADKPKLSKGIKKVNKEKEHKIKISNELKNLGIDMTSPTKSPFTTFEENILSGGVKTSICEMVKTKARYCSNSSSLAKVQTPCNVRATEINIPNKVIKESQEKILKKTEIKNNAKNEESDVDKMSLEQSKSDEQIACNAKIVTSTDKLKDKPDTKASTSSAKAVRKDDEKGSQSSNSNAVEAAALKPKRKYIKKIERTCTAKNINSELTESKLETKLCEKSSNEIPYIQGKNTESQFNISEMNEISNSIGKPSEGKNSFATNVNKIKRKYVKKPKLTEGLNQIDGNSKEKSELQKKLGNEEKDKQSDISEEKNLVDKIPKQNSKDEGAKHFKALAKPAAVAKAKDNTIKKLINPKKADEQIQNGGLKKSKTIVEKDQLKLNSTDSEHSSSETSDSEDNYSVESFNKPKKPVRNNCKTKQKHIGFNCTRVASLNAIAKVHCLYENETRAALEASIMKQASIKRPRVYYEDTTDDDESDNKETELVEKRLLRTAPGLLSIGKHWEMDSSSSDEIDSERDVVNKDVKDGKSIKAMNVKRPSKQEAKLKSKIKKTIKKSIRPNSTSEDSHHEDDSDKDIDKKSLVRKKLKPIARKPTSTTKKLIDINRKKPKEDDKNCDKNVVKKKRMASLNAKAILAASYENENYAAKHESSSEDSSSDDNVANKDSEPPTMKKEKKDVKMESEESRPKSTNLVKIDTDVTITGVYVNTSALVSSQETICKTLKYRTAYSVTEECVVSRPPTQEPPKSYTPLSALTNMRPPGGQTEPCILSPPDQYQHPQQPMYDPHMAPYQYPPPPPTASNYNQMPSTSSAFYPPPQQQQIHHRDPMGYYQPAGPLISQHILPPQQIPPPLESDQTQSPQSSASTADNGDPDVMITDTPQYHHNASCPCPMQSCPKNALTGTGPIKGPVSANISNALVDNIPSINNNNTTSNNISCKIENILTPNVVIKPETSVDDNSSTHTKPHETYENLQHLHPAYSMSNHKMLEPPELTLSPARGSTGLQIPPTVQHEAVQPTENNLNASDNNVSLSQRKQPRVGKSMERERQQMAMTGYQTTLDNAIALEVSHFKQEFEVKKEGSIVKKEKDCDDNDTITERYQSNNTLTKSIENVKLERPETQLEPIQVPPKQTENDMIDRNTINLINESGDECLDYSISKRRLNDSDDVIELSDNSTLDPPVSTLKRRKLLEIPISTPKKSPPNSYKSLIKRNNPSSPTHTNSTSKSKLISTNFNRINNKLCVKRRSIFKNKMSIKKFRLAAKAKRKALKKKISQEDTQNRDNEENATTAMKTNEIENVLDTNENDQSKSTDIVENVTSPQVQSEHIEDKSMDGSSEYSGKSNIDVTIDRVAKGYFSESEIFSCLSKHRKTKSQKKFDAKLLKAGVAGKKKYNKADVVVDSVPTVTKTKKKGKAKKGLESVAIAIVKQTKTKKFNTKESTNDLAKNSKKKPKDEKRLKDDLIIETDPLAIDNTPASHSTPKRKHPKQSRTIEKKSNKKCKVNEPIEIVIEPSKPEIEENEKTIATKDETISSVSSSTETVKCSKPLLDETDVANNNDECFEDNNTRQKHQESLTLYKTPGYGWTTLHKSSGKRGKKSKFSNRKKHKLTLLNEIVIPKSTSIPRWSNGWVWEGEPYQALVFLNSDDPPVYRTCYDSMRHEECGDIIRPRDCVLLRAGGKRNELPYVAKVAQLWENPEDGEMMMSLFWYYRPEHTEQGRQDMDASDEVFASRHKDHNSVACIEDKCHVLSYSEYCRYRKTLRSIEENIEEHQSLVPKMHESDRRAVPLSTSPELVMFCRRIYDFRGKRLVEDKKKK